MAPRQQPAGDEAPPRHDLPADERRQQLARVAAALASVPGLRLAFAFGSFARGEPFRDLDLAVWLDDPASRAVLGAVEDAAAAALGTIATPIDVVPLNDATPAFQSEVAERGQLLFEREPGAALAMRVRAHVQAIDYSEWRRLHAGTDA